VRSATPNAWARASDPYSVLSRLAAFTSKKANGPIIGMATITSVQIARAVSGKSRARRRQSATIMGTSQTTTRSKLKSKLGHMGIGSIVIYEQYQPLLLIVSLLET
jgi:hypothetical protein